MRPVPNTPAKGGHRTGVDLRMSGSGPRRANGGSKPMSRPTPKSGTTGPK